MKNLILMATLLFSAKALSAGWTPSLSLANKVAYQIIKNDNMDLFKQKVLKEGMSPNLQYNSKFDDNGVIDSNWAVLVTGGADQEIGRGEFDGNSLKNARITFLELKADPNQKGPEGRRPITNSQYHKTWELLVKEWGADVNHVFGYKTIGDRAYVVKAIHNIRYQEDYRKLVELGASPVGEKNCETFIKTDKLYNRYRSSNEGEAMRINYRDLLVKKFNISKKEFFRCAGIKIGYESLCTDHPEICQESYDEIMAE